MNELDRLRTLLKNFDKLYSLSETDRRLRHGLILTIPFSLLLQINAVLNNFFCTECDELIKEGEDIEIAGGGSLVHDTEKCNADYVYPS